MIRLLIGALVVLAAFAYVVVFMSVPNEPRRYYNDRSLFKEIRP